MTDRYVYIAPSKDGAHTFASWSEHALGAVGAFLTRITRFRMGQARHLTAKVRCSARCRRDLLACSVQVEPER